MKKLITLTLSAILSFTLLIPSIGSAASGEVYYPVDGFGRSYAGIFKSLPNGKPSLVLKENLYAWKELKTPPIKLEDLNFYYSKGKQVSKGDYGTIDNPISHVQLVGKDLYFTKFLFGAEYYGGCGGGFADIYEIYKRDSKGKVTKVVSDRISSDAQTPFKVIGTSLYYAKVTNKGYGNFTIVKMDLRSEKKQEMGKGVDDFWVQGNQIFFVKYNNLYKRDIKTQAVTNLNINKAQLRGANGCGEGNYNISMNGMVFEKWQTNESVTYYMDFSTKKLTKLNHDGSLYIVDADPTKKRFIALKRDYNKNTSSLGVYNLEGKLIKELKSLKPDGYMNFHTLDAKNGKIQYIEGTSFKLIKF